MTQTPRFRTPVRKAVGVLATLTALGALLVACNGQKTEDQKAEDQKAGNNGSINVYTSRHYDADTHIYEAFEKETGIKVNRLEMQAAQLVERMKAEGASSPADVILMADAGALWKAQDAGLYQPLQSDVINAKIPANLREPSGQWFGFSRRARVIIYDKAKVKPEEVATYEALATPRFKGKICVRSSDNVYNLSLMAAVIEHLGPEKALEWAKGVTANMARDPQGGDRDQIKAVAAGICEVAISNTYYYLRMTHNADELDQAVVDKTAMAFPSLAGQGTHVNISGGGLAKHAPNRDNAVKFLEYMTNDASQTIFAKYNNEFPVITTSETPEHIKALDGFKADPVNVLTYGARQAEAQKLLDQAGWK